MREAQGDRTVFLFDLDQTLLQAGGAGRMAFEQAFRFTLGDAGALAGVPFAGRTDRAILAEAMARTPVPVAERPAALREITDLYLATLPAALETCEGAPLPGAHELLKALASHENVTLGLATGNLRRAAMLKIRHAGMTAWLRDGGFGDDHVSRADMVADAARALAPSGSGARYVVIGDTPMDIAAAKANSFVAVGVATGGSSAATLADGGADVVLPDLRDTARVVDRLLSLALQ